MQNFPKDWKLKDLFAGNGSSIRLKMWNMQRMATSLVVWETLQSSADGKYTILKRFHGKYKKSSSNNGNKMYLDSDDDKRTLKNES